MNFSKMMSSLVSTPLHEIFKEARSLKEAGKDIISLNVGEPHCLIEKVILDAINRRMILRRFDYLPALGSTELRTKIGELYGVEPVQVAIGSGAKSLVAMALTALLRPENSVLLLPTPYYPPFYQVAKALGVLIVEIDTQKNNFQLTLELLVKTRKKIKRRHQVLIINSPNNPTGVIYDKGELCRITAYCREHAIQIISDECYSTFSTDPSFTLFDFSIKDDESSNVTIINSFSKSHALMGLRIGYLVGSAELVKRLGMYAENFLGCPSVLAETAALEAINTKTVGNYDGQRAILEEWLSSHEFKFTPTFGGIYTFADFTPVSKMLKLKKSAELGLEILKHSGVALAPGHSFGKKYENFLRISYSVSQETLCEALHRLDVMFANFQKGEKA